jgi:hypothetical protein
LRLNIEEVNQLLSASRNPGFEKLRELARYEYELELLDEFSRMSLLAAAQL